MGIMGMIAKTKKGFHDTRIKIISGQTAKIQEANLREAELTRAKQEYREARQIRADLRADQLKQVEGEKPSKLKALGQGMAKHMNQAKVPSAKHTKVSQPPMVGVPTSNLNQPTSTQQGGIFGGQRNIDVGGERGSPFNQQKPKRLF